MTRIRFGFVPRAWRALSVAFGSFVTFSAPLQLHVFVAARATRPQAKSMHASATFPDSNLYHKKPHCFPFLQSIFLLVAAATTAFAGKANLLVAKEVVNNAVVQDRDLVIKYTIFNTGNGVATDVTLTDEDVSNHGNLHHYSRAQPLGTIAIVLAACGCLFKLPTYRKQLSPPLISLTYLIHSFFPFLPSLFPLPPILFCASECAMIPDTAACVPSQHIAPRSLAGLSRR